MGQSAPTILVRTMVGKVALIGLGLILAALLAELGLRVVAIFNAPVRYLVTVGVGGDRPTFRNLGAYVAAQGPHLVPHRDFLNFWTNAFGFHDLEFEVPKPAGRFRVMALGDSYTYGNVPYPDAVMTRLEDALRAGCPHTSLDLLNFGIGGAGVWDYRTIFGLAASTFDPDLVLVNFYMGNDGPDVYHRQPKSPKRDPFFWRLYLVRYVHRLTQLATGLERDDGAWSPRPDSAVSQRGQGGTMVNPTSPLGADDLRLTGPTFTEERFAEIMWTELRRFARDPASDDPEVAWRETLAILDLLRREVAARGGRLVLTLYPSALQVDPDLPAALVEQLRSRPRLADLSLAQVDLQLPNRMTLAYCHAVGIRCHDVTPDLIAARRESSEPLYKERDTHWTIRGNRVAADAQARWLRGLVCP